MRRIGRGVGGFVLLLLAALSGMFAFAGRGGQHSIGEFLSGPVHSNTVLFGIGCVMLLGTGISVARTGRSNVLLGGALAVAGVLVPAPGGGMATWSDILPFLGMGVALCVASVLALARADA